MIKIIKFKKEHAKPLAHLINQNVKTLLPKFYNRKVINFLCKSMDDNYLVKSSEKRDLFVALDGKKFVGIAGLEKNEVRSVYVHVNMQRKGIGKKLMRKIENSAKKKGYKKIIVRSSLYSVNFYNNLGYKKIRKVFRKFDNSIVLDEVLMNKLI